MTTKEIVYLKVAGFVVRIIFFLSSDGLKFEKSFVKIIRNYYRNFLVEDNGLKVNYNIEIVHQYSFKVIFTKDNKHIHMSFYEQLNSKKIRTYYHISGTQFQIIFRKITHELLVKHKGFILHASASRVGNEAVLFLGKSGAGKSTTMKILADQLDPLGDDSMIIKYEQNNYYCYSSSAKEKNDWFLKNHNRIKLKTVYFLEKSKEIKIKQIKDKHKVLDLVSKQLFSEKNDILKQMKNLAYFVQRFNEFYHLGVSLKYKDQLIEIVKKNN